MATAGSVIIDLLMKTGSFETDSKRAEKRVREMQRAITGSFKTMAAGVAGFAGAFLSVQAVFDGFKGAIDAADKLNDFNQRLGISAEALSGWGYAAKQSGTDIDALGKGMLRLSKNMAAALDPKSQESGLFAALGVDVKDAQGKLRSLESVLPEVADAFKALNNETLEAALAQEVFGKSGAELLEFLNQGSDGLNLMRERARELGIELDQNTLTAADAFNDTVGDLQAATQGFFTQLSAELLPALTEFTRALVDVVKDGSAAADMAKTISFGLELIENGLNRIDGLGDVIEGIVDGFWDLVNVSNALMGGNFALAMNLIRNSGSDSKIAGGALQMVTGQRAEKPRGTFDNVTSGGGEVLQGRELALVQARMKKQADAEQRLLDFFNGKDSDKKAKGRSGKSDAEKEAERLASAAESLSASLKEQLALFGSTTEAAQVYFEVTQGGLAKLDPAKKQQLLDMATELDLMKQRQEEIDKEIKKQEELDEAKKRAQEHVSEFISDMEFELELIGMTNKEREREIALRYAGAGATEEQRKKITELTDAQMQASKVADFWDNTQQELASSLYDLAKNAENAGDIVKGFFDAIGDYITRAIAENWAEQITDLFRSGSGESASGGTSGGGFWASLAGAIFGGGKAGGGDVMGGHAYLIGERGPEMFIPRTAGTVVPNDRMSSAFGGGGRNFTQNLNVVVAGRPDRSTPEQIARATAREGVRGMSRTGR